MPPSHSFRPFFRVARWLVLPLFLLVFFNTQSQTAHAATWTVLDQFGTAAYTNNNGTANWAGNWIETGEVTNPTAGRIQIVGGELRFAPPAVGAATVSIEREVNLTAANSATLTYTCRASVNHENADIVTVSVSNDGGTRWYALKTISLNTINGANCPANFQSFDITNYISASTNLRVRFTHLSDQTNEQFFVDNVQIQYTEPDLVANQVTGYVFRDYNATGLRDGDEPGLAGVTVYGVDAGGNTATTTTNALGAYTLTGLTGMSRIEFIPTAAQQGYLYPGKAGNSSVEFVNATTGAILNVGFNNPAQYSQANPQVAMPIFSRENQIGNNDPVVRSHPYFDAGTTPTLTTHATADQVGTLYGMAYQASSGSLFGGAYVRRGAGLGPGNSMGSIYKLTGSGAPAAFLDLSALGVNMGTNPRPGNTPVTSWTVDTNTYAAVGKVGLGDIEISEDETTLYAVNLNERTVVIMPMTFDASGNPIAPTAGQISSVTVPVPATCNGNGTTTPAASDWRPFALKFYDGKLYVGGVCSAQSLVVSNNPTTFAQLATIRPQMRAHVYEFDPATNTFNTTPIFTMPLDYAREQTNDGYTGAPNNDGEWLPWSDVWRPAYSAFTGGAINGNPQPMLVDIEFDGDGFMTLGFRDRYADQSYATGDPGPANAATTNQRYGGDVLLACLDAGGNWQLESASSCTNGVTGETRTAGGSTDSGPQSPEFYHNEQFLNTGLPGNPQFHDETAWGALALRHGSGEILVTKYDTFATFEAGTIAFGETTGNRARAVQMYTNVATRFGKAGGMGDIELLVDVAPSEIGNRLWQDSNGNGLQDPNETGLNGVTLQLWADTDGNGSIDAQVAQTTTDANGRYLFSRTGTNSYGQAENWTFTAANAVAPNTAYEIRADLTQVALSGRSLTVANAAQPASGNTSVTDNNYFTDLADSDAAQVSTTAVIAYTTERHGANNHTLDIGFTTYDWGDLPDSFDTTAANNGPRHNLSSTLRLGACVDGESNGLPDAEAGTDGSGGDDNNTGTGTLGSCATAGDDEDGVTLVTPLIANHQACVRVTATNSTGGAANLYGWVDFNGDGDFDGDANELLSTGNFVGGVATVPNGGVTNQNYCFTVPAGATFDGGETHLRFRLTTNTLGGLTPWAGSATNGEIEDYYTPLACVGNYLWFDTGSSANVQDATDTPVPNGTAVNLVWAGPDGVAGNGDDVTYSTTTGANGLYSFCGLRTDANGDSTADPYRIVVPTAPGTPVTADQGGNDALDSDGTINGPASQGPLFTVPLPNAVNDNAPNDTDPNNYPDNRTDLTFDFGFQTNLDWGDLPEAGTSYATTLANNGARHILDGATYMGNCVDAEANGQPNTQAGMTGVGGDDGNVGSTTTGTCTTAGDDEDGVTFLTPLAANRPASFQVATSGNSCLSLFVDVDGNGTLDTVTIATGSPTGTAGNPLTDVALTGTGPHVFRINIPSTAAGTMYSRFRLTAACGQGGATATGVATSGEVEDYVLAAVGDLVWEDTNVNGLQGEAPTANVTGLTVRLLDGSGNPVNDAAGNPITTSTAANGSYAFPGLLPGVNYRVEFTAPPGFGFTPRDQGLNDGIDSDANVFNGRTIAFSVPPSVTDLSHDAGIYPITNQAIGNRVWADQGTGGGVQNNGAMDGGETGINGAVVRLYIDAASDGPDAGDVAGAPVMQYNTDSDGYYIFPNVTPGTTYFVCVVGSTTGYSTSSGSPIGNHPPSGTEENQANGDDGTPLGTGTLVCSQTFAAQVGTAPTDELVNPVGYANANANMKLDFGFTSSPTAVTLQAAQANPASRSVWLVAAFLLLVLITLPTLVKKQRAHA